MASDVHPELSQSYDASNAAEVERAKLASARREKVQRDFLVEILSSKAGRDWIWDLLSSTNMFGQPPTRDPADVNFWLGERNVGLRLWLQIEAADPNALITMMKAQKGRIDA